MWSKGKRTLPMSKARNGFILMFEACKHVLLVCSDHFIKRVNVEFCGSRAVCGFRRNVLL
ncbi:MAG: hypothetical protein OEL83_09635, partial [Desulforhopalus sp.]|nr:hypothetical protein [Desulforhopalus sp.]